MKHTAEIPGYWRNRLEDIEDTLASVRRGQVRKLVQSAGNRPIYAVSYGEKQVFERKANYSSACGAGDLSAYAEKDENSKPVVLLVGGVHGGELEGIAAVLNWIQLLETGTDYRGKSNPILSKISNLVRLILIPCMNPDGRARIPVQTLVGMPFEEMRYHIQGTWKDGSLCNWPGCKAVHPILHDVSHLGGYFNDDGINLMHDRFFSPMARETKALMELVDEEAADATILLHGGANTVNHILPVPYIPASIQEIQDTFVERLYQAAAARNLRFRRFFNKDQQGTRGVPRSFNLTAALHHISGGLSMTYESNMSLSDAPGERFSYEEIMDSHDVLIEELLRFMLEDKPLQPLRSTAKRRE